MNLLSNQLLTLFAARGIIYWSSIINSWYLSRALRKNGWKSNLLDWDENISWLLSWHISV